MIEVELRSFVSPEKFVELLSFFQAHAKVSPEDTQVTYYLNRAESSTLWPHDLRIQKNNSYSKVWLKKGALHDSAREEIEIRCSRDDFDKLEQLFLSLGYTVRIKWFRLRHQFEWEGVTVCLDYTKGYGHIIEFEKLCEEFEKEKALACLKQKFQTFSIPLFEKVEFDKKFKHYKENWESLVGLNE